MNNNLNRIWILIALECLFLASCGLFMFFDMYYQWYIDQHPEYEFHKVMALFQFMFGIFVTECFGIALLIKVKSVLHFFVGLLLTSNQLVLSFFFMASGSYEIGNMVMFGLILYVFLTMIHTYLAIQWFKTLSLRNKSIN